MRNKLNSGNYFGILNMIESSYNQGTLPKSVFFGLIFSSMGVF